MKYSIFNSRIKLSKNTDIIFNSLTENFIIIPKNKYINLSTIDRDTLIKFKFLGIVCENDENEEKKN